MEENQPLRERIEDINIWGFNRAWIRKRVLAELDKTYEEIESILDSTGCPCTGCKVLTLKALGRRKA